MILLADQDSAEGSPQTKEVCCGARLSYVEQKNQFFPGGPEEIYCRDSNAEETITLRSLPRELAEPQAGAGKNRSTGPPR